MALISLLCFAVCVVTVLGQRPSFAGTKPIGFPELYDRPTPDPLVDK